MTDRVPLRLVVPTDGTPLSVQAIPFAQALAAPPAEIILVEVLHQAQPERTLLGQVARGADVVQRREAHHAAETLWANAGRIQIDTPWITVDVVTAVGNPVDQILRVAGEREADCVVIAHGDRSVAGRLLLGSVTDGLVESGAVPVLVVRERDTTPGLQPAAIRRLLLALDSSPAAERAVRLAERMAKHADLPLHIVTVLEDGQKTVAPSVEVHRSHLRERGVRATVELLQGAPQRAIQEAAGPEDLLVIGSGHGTGWKAWLSRGMTEHLIAHASCPVLVVHGNGQSEPRH
jgi:nucleotide-binding universal stress UspA family protein